ERVREDAYQTFARPILAERERTVALLRRAAQQSGEERIADLAAQLERQPEPGRRFADVAMDSALVLLRDRDVPSRMELRARLGPYREESPERFRSHVYGTSARPPLRIPPVPAEYAADAETVDGRVVLLRCFDQLLARDKRVFIIGED